jgi:uncharacterized RDD family membrane protein YckC
VNASVDLPPAPIPTHRADVEFAEVGESGPVPLATIGARLLARLIDQLIVGIPAVLLAIFLLPEFTSTWSTLAAPAGALALTLVYEVVMIGARGATLGKQLTGIEVAKATTGTRPGVGRALIRTVVILGVSILPLGALAIVVSTLRDEDRRRGWHDRAAGTIVIAAR